MKKLMCATAILASFAAIGAVPAGSNAISFEGYTSETTLQLVNGVNEYDEDGTQESCPYFFFEGTADASIVKTFGGDNLAAPTIARPSFFAGTTPNDNYLEVDTASGTLWRSFSNASREGMGEALPIADEGTYVDTLMQFTPVPATVPIETGAEDKLAIRLQIDSSGGTPVTNLIVRAAYVNDDGTETSVVATNYTLNTASPVVPGQWYRLTVKVLADVTQCQERSAGRSEGSRASRVLKSTWTASSWLRRRRPSAPDTWLTPRMNTAGWTKAGTRTSSRTSRAARYFPACWGRLPTPLSRPSVSRARVPSMTL